MLPPPLTSGSNTAAGHAATHAVHSTSMTSTPGTRCITTVDSQTTRSSSVFTTSLCQMILSSTCPGTWVCPADGGIYQACTDLSNDVAAVHLYLYQANPSSKGCAPRQRPRPSRRTQALTHRQALRRLDNCIGFLEWIYLADQVQKLHTNRSHGLVSAMASIHLRGPERPCWHFQKRRSRRCKLLFW